MRPSFLQRLSTDEYFPPPWSAAELRAARATAETVASNAERLRTIPTWYASSRLGTAAGLRALNAEFGADYYKVPVDAEFDAEAARRVFDGGEVVIDVQTHFFSQRPETIAKTPHMMESYRRAMPTWWTGLDDLTEYDMANYLRCVFLESETAVAVLSSGPGLGPERLLFNDEMAGTRGLFDRLAGSGRLLNHAVVHPDVDDDLAAMEQWADRYQPAAWKVYTMGRMDYSLGKEGALLAGPVGGSSWRLDDEVGFRFLSKARELGVSRVCAHKGISWMADTSSPRDVGPAAVEFPDLTFIIYHSGYEQPGPGFPPEGAYSEETLDVGVNRLIASVGGSGLGPGSNVYAELGTTWFSLIRRPMEAAHVLGKLLVALGADNVIWGSDSIWYGPVQPAIDAFRAFQIPPEMRERFGYPELTPEIKRKILGENAARVYGLDLDSVRVASANDDLGWARAVLDEYTTSGIPRA